MFLCDLRRHADVDQICITREICSLRIRNNPTPKTVTAVFPKIHPSQMILRDEPTQKQSRIERQMYSQMAKPFFARRSCLSTTAFIYMKIYTSGIFSLTTFP